MGPVVLLTVAFLTGLMGPWCPSALPTALLSLLAAGSGARLARPCPGLAALSLAVSAALSGAALAGTLRLSPPTTLATDTRRVHGRVTSGCLDDDRGARCTVETTLYGTADLHVTGGRCDAAPGDRIDLIATVRPIVPLRNPPRVDPETSRVLRGVRVRLDASACTVVGRGWDLRDLLRRLALRTRVATVRALARALPPEGADRARALLFGDTATLDTASRDAFRASGLAHLLAVSGAHVALLIALLGTVARAALVRVRPLAVRGISVRVAPLLPLPFAGFFILVTGESPSSVRALITATLTALFALAGRAPRGTALVAGVALAMAAVSPPLVLDPGWELSVLAAWTLAAAPRRDPLPDATGLVQGVARAFTEALATSTRVAVAVAPLLAWLGGRAPVLATVANVVAAPLGEAILLPGVLAAAAVGILAPAPVAHAVGWLLSPLLAALFDLPRIAMRLPLASVALPLPTPCECAVATVCVLGALASRPRAALAWSLVGLGVVGALEVGHRGAVHPTGVLRVTALDVGQGDAVLVDLPDGTAMLIDGGGALSGGPDPGARAVVPWLSLQRHTHLVAVVLSHPHPDHAGGLAAVLSSVHADALWDTGQGSALGYAGAYAAVLTAARANGVPVLGPANLCGAPRAFHGAVLEVLAPCPGPRDGDAPNDASFVLRLSLGRGSVLLPGDLERAGEARLAGTLAPVTVLKVPHHGSRTSSTEGFLRALRPRVALVSCGHPSPFGHPHPEVVARYRALGIDVRRTDVSGAVSATVFPDGRVQ